MNAMRRVGGWVCLFLGGGSLTFSGFEAKAQPADEFRVEVVQNVVEVSTDRGTRWLRIQTNAILRVGDRLRTGQNSKTALRLSAATVLNFPQLTEIEILAPEPQMEPGVHIFRGLMSFFHKGKPGRIKIRSNEAVAGVDGTEFVVAVDTVNGKERTTLTVIDGLVSFGNGSETLPLKNGDAAMVEGGAAPVRIAGIVANNLLQWAFYYPAVLDLRDLTLAPAEEQPLTESIAAYRQGNLLRALDAYGNRVPNSESERIYHAALLLAVGQVTPASEALRQIGQQNPTNRNGRLAAALQQQIAAVKRERVATVREPELATELLAGSYYEQSLARGDETLKRALDFAKGAATNSPEFGFAWARVAELEFSFGRTAKAKEAVDKSLQVSPRNAQALALNGFLLAAQNKPSEAIVWFDRAIAADAALANAWLGRGLCRIRRGDLTGGQDDLLIAAALEPQRAALRSYLGKAYGESNDKVRALHELELAKRLDTNDPTGWFYSALLKGEYSRVNEGIRDLEKSQELNDNRRVYRNEFLLDQDKAVRSVNLARLYADSDLGDVAVHEAGRAVSYDYANYSAHAFLANSYEVERRANLSNLRFEAASFGEYLLANLLGPANGRLLAQPVTQLEYSSLFERNRFGLIANTEYFSRGAWHHSSAQYGTYNGSSYSLEAEYRSEAGERKNQDHEIRQLEAKFKHDITTDDSVYFHVIDYHAEGGDILQRFDEREVSKTFRFKEEQTPTILAGYHHQWSPQNHTLFLAGRFDDTLDAGDPFATVIARDPNDMVLTPVTARNSYRSRVELYTTEAQQIIGLGRHSLVGGARFQWSKQTVKSRIEDPFGDFADELGKNDPVTAQKEEVWSSSSVIYAYDYLRLLDSLQIVGGLNFTHQSLPVNMNTAPVSSDREHQERVSPKVAIIWSPSPASIIRGSYTRSLTGAGLGQSVRLEPTHVAGLLQTFRAPAPVALLGDLDGANLETAELLWEGRFRDTYVSLGGQWLEAERNRRSGLFFADPAYIPGPTFGLIREHVRFDEQAFDVSLHQLVSKEWSFGVRYRLAHAQLERNFPDYPARAVGKLTDRSEWQGWLHTVALSGLYRHHSGVFARAEGVLFAQDREQEHRSFDGERELNDLPEDNFWEVNVIAGYRFPKQKAEIAVGVLNIFDTDYRLDPINSHAEQPRSRTFYARLFINF